MKPNFFFKTISRFLLPVMILGFSEAVFAQAQSTLPDTSKMGYNQISSTLKLYPFPAKGQSQQQQKTDEFDCYKWAVQQSGVDPANPPKVEAAPAKSGPTGAAVGGAAKGAVAGVAVGAITGDAGEGAAVGAVAGGLAGRRAGKKAQKQQNQKAQTDAASKQKELTDSFAKAFSSCMEGKGYTIK